MLRFESVAPGCRHGVWLAAEGELEVNGVRGGRLVVWTDTAPPEVQIEVVSTDDGVLRVDNVWMPGDKLGREPHIIAGGMLREVIEGGRRYRCNAISDVPEFDSLVFTVTRP